MALFVEAGAFKYAGLYYAYLIQKSGEEDGWAALPKALDKRQMQLIKCVQVSDVLAIRAAANKLTHTRTERVTCMAHCGKLDLLWVHPGWRRVSDSVG